MILLKLSRYKSVCETIKQLKLFSCAKCLKKSRTNPDVSLSSEDKTSSIDNILRVKRMIKLHTAILSNKKVIFKSDEGDTNEV